MIKKIILGYKNIDGFRCLNGAQLKWIAMLSMLIDHFNKGILFSLIIVKEYSPKWILVTSSLFEILGRIAFPIFLFLLVEGFFHTRNRLKYFSYLMIFGVISEVPYDMFESGEYCDWGGQNMFFTLALALLTLCVIDIVRKRAPKWWILIAIIITLSSSFLSAILALDYTYYGIIIPVLFYLLPARRLLASVSSYVIIIKEIWSFVGFVLVNLYNGERGRINKWIGYWFYPIHLLLIGLIRMFVIKV